MRRAAGEVGGGWGAAAEGGDAQPARDAHQERDASRGVAARGGRACRGGVSPAPLTQLSLVCSCAKLCASDDVGLDGCTRR